MEGRHWQWTRTTRSRRHSQTLSNKWEEGDIRKYLCVLITHVGMNAKVALMCRLMDE